ncbi:hypothetical protein EDD21DRAFT_393682 [Dissophora ornata]|nr:hypothetical protein EDD21DRAFT_393682 [Dissophora ornata]
MEYARMPNIATALPHFRESFPSPSLKVPKEYESTPYNNNTFVAPLSASSLQAYNNMNASMMGTKRKSGDFEHIQNENELSLHDPKRTMLERPFGRQRQESGCSVSSASSWSSSASFSTVCSSATVPDLSASPQSRSLTSSRSPSPSESLSEGGEEYNPLWHICDAIALAEKQDVPKKMNRTKVAAGSSIPYTPKAKQGDDNGLKIVFLEPNWVAEHIAKSKKVAALKKQQQQHYRQ